MQENLAPSTTTTWHPAWRPGRLDRQVLRYQNGRTIFEQPDKSRADLGYLLPFHMDSTAVDAQNAGDLDHSWTGDHSARNGGPG